jgi:squalene-associated FAD-dependent desaturase
MKKVIIIGGGISGLASAVFLSEAGYNVSIYEACNHLGGRAYSFIDRDSKYTLDNGQHILMGCYQYTLEYLRKIGAFQYLDIENNLNASFKGIDKTAFKLKCNNLPAPLHIFHGLKKIEFVSTKDLFRFFIFGMNIYFYHFLKKREDNAKQFLKSLNQREEIIKKIWEPIIISVFNSKSTDISAQLFIDTMYEIFFRHNHFSNFILPASSLENIFVSPAEKYIISNKGKIFLNKKISKFNIDGNRMFSIETIKGERIEGDIFISSVPPNSLQRIIGGNKIISENYFKNFKCSPIIAGYILLNKQTINDKVQFFLNSNIQVLFNKTKICGLDSDTQLLSFVVSAADDLITKTTKELETLFLNELLFLFPSLNLENILFCKVLKQRESTFTFDCTTNNRMTTKTKIDNMFFVGDWTETGLPMTIESAVKSAYLKVGLLGVS